MGALTTGRLFLLFSPDSIDIDFDKKEINLKSGEPTDVNLSDLIDAELLYHGHCADLLLESKLRRYTVRGLNKRRARKLKSLLRSYIWNRIIKSQK